MNSKKPGDIRIADFTYFLPQERIAAFPLYKRDHSKLLVYKEGSITDDRFYNLPSLLPFGTMLVLNDTRVIEARILFRKTSGAFIEVFCLEPHEASMETALSQKGSVQWKCLIGGASKWKHGQILKKELSIGDHQVILSARYISKQTNSFILSFSWDVPEFSFSEILHAAGVMPLPPYIKRPVEEADKERYQTIFGQTDGSVAAPTAALHFTENIFDQLNKKDIRLAHITLHVGAGTFKPVKSETLGEHEMHSEPFTISKKVLEQILESKKVIAVGTTSLRTLESIYWLGVKLMHGSLQEGWSLQQWEVYELEEKFPGVSVKESLGGLINWLSQKNLDELHCNTSLIIVPGYKFKIPVAIVTNFHQPQSTLLLLIAAFIGNSWKNVYRHALENNYRFLSYGDSSLLWREEE